MIPRLEAYCLSKPLHLANIVAVLLIGVALSCPGLVVAQSSTPADNPVQVGDHWTFDSRDEITGLPRDTYTLLVTEVSPNEIVVRQSFRRQSGFSIIVYDHNWDRIETSNIKWKPNDNRGIRPPLAVGKEWRSELEARNTENGAAFKNTILSKVVAQETLTATAGMLDTFKIETRIREFNVANPSKTWDYESVNWYAPLTNFWVRRQFLTKVQKRTTERISEELIEFGRKP